MRPGNSAYDRDTRTTDEFSVCRIAGEGWAAYGPDRNGVEVPAEPWACYATKRKAIEAAENLAAQEGAEAEED